MIPDSYSSLCLKKPAEAAGSYEHDSGIVLVNSDSGITGDSGTISPVSEFAALFRHYLADRGISTRRLAQVTKTSQSSVTKAAKGDAPPPLDHLPLWGRALDLKGNDLAQFIELGHKAKAANKKDIAPYVQTQESRIIALETALAELITMLRDAGAEVPKRLLKLLDS